MHGYAIFVTLCKGGSLCDFVFTPLQNRAPCGTGSTLGGMNLSQIQVLHLRNWSLFLEGRREKCDRGCFSYSVSIRLYLSEFCIRHYNVQLYKV